MVVRAKVFVGIVAIFMIFGVVTGAVIPYMTGDTVTITVKEKERVQDRDNNGSKYLIFTETEVFENTDNFFVWKFNSSDVYNQLDEGKNYTVKVYGWRVPFLSMYRNIVEVKE